MDSLASFSEALGTIRSAKGDFLVHWRGNDGHDSRRIVTPESPSFPRTREHFGTVFLPLYGTFANNEHNAGRQFQLRSSAIWRIGNESEYAGRGHGAIASCASGRAIAYSRGGASCSPRRDQTRWQARHHAPPSSLTKNLIWRQRKSLPSLKGRILSFLHGPYFFKPRNVKRFQSCHQPRMQDHRRRPSMHVVCIRPLHSYSLHYHNFKVECYSNVVQK